MNAEKPEKGEKVPEEDSSRAKQTSTVNELNFSATLNSDVNPYSKVRQNSKIDVEIGEEEDTSHGAVISSSRYQVAC